MTDDQIAELRGLVERERIPFDPTKMYGVDYDREKVETWRAITRQVPALLSRIDALTEALRVANRTANDRAYMLAAVVQMLESKGRQVWDMWQAKGVVRQHTSWCPDAALLTGEEIAQVHLDCEEAVKTAVPISNIDEHRARSTLAGADGEGK